MASFTLTPVEEEKEDPVVVLKTGGFTLTPVPEKLQREKVVATLPQQVDSAMKTEEEKEEEVPESPEPASFTTDLKRLALRHATNFTTALATVGSGRFPVPESTQKRLAGNTGRDIASNLSSGEVEKGALKALSNISGYKLEENPNLVENGRIKQLDTLGGQAVDISTFMLGGWRMAAGQKTIPSILSWELASQLFMDSNNNLFNGIQDAVDNNDGEQTDGELVLDMLAASPDDTPLQNRARLLGEGLGVGLLFSAVTAIPTAILRGRKPAEMSKEELAQTVAEFVSRSEKYTEVPQKGGSYGRDTQEGIDQIIGQAVEGKTKTGEVAMSRIRRLKQKYVTSRGNSSRLIFKALSESKYTQRQIVSKAERIAAKVRTTYDIGGTDAGKLNTLLSSDLSDVLKLDLEKQAAALAKKEGISDESAEALLEARYAIDELSEEIRNTPGFSKEVKESIGANIGQYLRRSYRLFEDPDYVPSTAATEKIDQFFTREFIQKQADLADGTLKLTPDQLAEMGEGASTYVKVQKNKLLGKAPDEMQDFVFQSKRVNAFRKKDDTIPDEILEYLGEIKDPAENIILSISKAVRTVEMQKAYTQIRKLGQNKYIFKTESEAIEASNKLGFDENIFSRQIGKNTDSVTNTSLDSMWTTPELIRVLRKDEETFKTLQKDGYLAATWRTYVGQKGFAQSMKTVYDHVTHTRNIVGGYQFGLANGRIFSHVNAPNQFKVLKSKVFDKAGKNIDSKKLKETYEKYLKLGIINTSVNVNQFREMLETGFQNKSPFRLLNKVAPEPVKSAVKTATDSNIYKYPKDLIVDKPQEIYMATDDYFKIGSFEAELSVLREALPNASEEVLEQEAAMIVRNTLPNYDQVPKGIKQLRNLPLGNFVAFPAEMLRTSVHIVKQASKEISSNNAVIKERGLKRLAGFTTTNLGWAAAADMSATALGFSEQDREDLNLLGSGPFSTGRDTIYFTDGDGELRGLNTQYLNSYYSVTSSVREGYDKFRAGKLQGKEVEDYLMDSVQAGVKDFMAPYLSTSLATEPLLAIGTALISDDGKDHTGRRLISDKSGIDMQRLAQIIGDPYIPGSITKGFKLSDALNEVPNKYNLKYQDPKYALISQSGFKSDSFSRSALIEGFEGKLKDYKYAENKNAIDRVRFSNVEKAEQDYIDVNDLRLQNQSDIYAAAQAAIRQIGSSTTNRLLLDSGVSKEERAAIVTGKFEPEATDYIEKVLKAEAKNVRKLKTIEERTEYRQKLKQKRSDILFLNKRMREVKLDRVSDFDPNEWLELNTKIQQRLQKSTGGEVSELIPNAPSEPDERINKLTGIPYNEGAGAAYMDTDDPLRVLKMNKGGSLYSRVSSLGEEVAAEQFGITPEVLKQYTEDTASLVNNLVDEGFFHARERAKTDEAGNLSGGDIFDAANHLRTAILAEDSQSLRNLAQLKELAQFVAGDRGPHGALGDSKNNLLGFEFYDKAEGNKEKFETLVKQNLIDRFSEREGYSAAGAVVKAGMKLFSKTKVPVPTKAAVKKTKDIAMPEELNPKVSNAEYEEKLKTFENIEDVNTWKKEVKEFVKNERSIDPVVRTPELEESARKVVAKEIDREEHLKNVEKYKPIKSWPNIPREPTSRSLIYSLEPNQIEKGKFILDAATSKAYGVAKSLLSIGDKFAGRLDIPAYKAFDTWIVAGTSKAEKGTHYAKAVHYGGKDGEPVKFLASQKTGERIGTGEKNKTGYATISGWIKDLDVNRLRATADNLIDNPEWTQVGFDPRRQGAFYARSGDNIGMAVTEADEVIQIGPLVFAKKVKVDPAYTGYASGGKVLNTLRRARK